MRKGDVPRQEDRRPLAWPLRRKIPEKYFYTISGRLSEFHLLGKFSMWSKDFDGRPWSSSKKFSEHFKWPQQSLQRAPQQSGTPTCKCQALPVILQSSMSSAPVSYQMAWKGPRVGCHDMSGEPWQSHLHSSVCFHCLPFLLPLRLPTWYLPVKLTWLRTCSRLQTYVRSFHPPAEGDASIGIDIR